jgi:hypothetical protein
MLGPAIEMQTRSRYMMTERSEMSVRTQLLVFVVGLQRLGLFSHELNLWAHGSEGGFEREEEGESLVLERKEQVVLVERRGLFILGVDDDRECGRSRSVCA